MLTGPAKELGDANKVSLNHLAETLAVAQRQVDPLDINCDPFDIRAEGPAIVPS